MSDDHSARLALPYLAAGQMQKHVTLNAALTRLDALVQTAAVSRPIRGQPTDAADGDLHILPNAAEGPDWSGRAAGSLMRFEGGGGQTPAPVGLVALVLDTATAVMRGEGGWSPLGQWLGELQALSRLGVGAVADAENPLAAKLNKALFAARGVVDGGTGDLRMTLNKEGADNILSSLFQSGRRGRRRRGRRDLHHDSRMRRWLRQDHPRSIELLDFEYWRVPGLLNKGHWRIQAGLNARPEPYFLDAEKPR